MKKERIEGIDGLRALSILGITFFHFFPNTIKGGYLGVCMFFILTGFFLSLSKVESWKTYYLKRIKRIYPALLLMIFTTIGIYFFLLPDGIATIRNEVISILTGWNNWWQISQNADYFTRISNASMFTPLWFLSIEMQVYLVWPLAYILYHKAKKKKGIRFAHSCVLILIVLSAVWMMVQYHPNQDVTRLYYGTDTRLFSILMGVYLGIIYQQHPLSKEKYMDLLITILFVILFICFIFCDGQAAYMYCGGFFLISLLMAVLLYALLHKNRWISILENKVFLWIGRRSYELFLWQYPVLFFFQSKNWNGIVSHLIEFVLIVFLAGWSHLFISNFKKMKKDTSLISMSVLTAFFCLFGGVGLIQSKGQKDVNEMQAHIEKNAENLKKQKKKKVKVAKKISINDVYCVGDSVMLASAESLQNQLPNCQINAEVSRQMVASISIVQDALNAGQIGKVVVVGLGTNGPLAQGDVDSLLDELGSEREVFWVNIYGPNLEWQDPNNQLIDQLVKKHKNVHKIDWYSLISQHPDWLWDDGIHPNDDGANAYADLVRSTIENTKSND